MIINITDIYFDNIGLGAVYNSIIIIITFVSLLYIYNIYNYTSYQECIVDF